MVPEAASWVLSVAPSTKCRRLMITSFAPEEARREVDLFGLSHRVDLLGVRPPASSLVRATLNTWSRPIAESR